MKATIVVYTHTDMKDVWPMFFGQFKKYINDYNVYVCVNKLDSDIPSDYTQITYDDSMPYTERWKQLLKQIKEDVIIFLHEDMVLIDTPNFELIQKYTNYVKTGIANGIKLIFGGSDDIKAEYDNTLVSNEYSKFSIQPTIIKTKTFLDLLSKVEPLNIWEFEDKVPIEDGHYMVRLGNEKRRGIYHNDSLVFPYIATAINKGKWNYTEYEKELNELFNIYNINPFERGIA